MTQLPRLLAVLLLLVFGGAAQQPVAKQEVPSNLADHPAPAQPLPFSHKTHVARGLECRRCHTNPDPGAQMTFPATSTCMTCHRTIAVDRPAILKLTEFAKSAEPIPWVRVYQITPGVTWSHRKHLQTGMQCVMCHGQVAQLDVIAQNTAILAMASCINCHQAHGASTACATCHIWPEP